MFYMVYHSKIGDIYLESDGEYLTALVFAGSRNMNKISHEIERKDLPVFLDTCKWLDTYFSGKNPDFEPKYKFTNLTPFRKEVYNILKTIPYGKTINYGEIAHSLALKKGIKKMSAQAVGGAVGSNPICIIVPCHRVVGTNGKLIGYGGGLKNKQVLLELETHFASIWKFYYIKSVYIRLLSSAVSYEQSADTSLLTTLE